MQELREIPLSKQEDLMALHKGDLVTYVMRLESQLYEAQRDLESKSLWLRRGRHSDIKQMRDLADIERRKQMTMEAQP